MPIILQAKEYDRGLGREETERLPLDLLKLYESEKMEMYEANPKVGNCRDNGPEMLKKTLDAAESATLSL